ncbi:hypothetical protein CPB86DRAFT_133913 [Serendipita vermifera]|nr:hypothetical protein CPB86DRAFT_133913 [Serendipita vermifera]
MSLPKSNIQIDIPMLREAQLFEETYRRLLPILHPEKVSSTTELLVKTLNGLPKLRWFGLTIPFESRAKFDEAVHKLNATDLPISARATSLGPFTQGILRHMLYVNDVAMYHWAFMYKINAQMAFIQAIVGLPLEGVQFWVDSDLKSNLEAVMNGIPSLKRLSLLGGGNGDIMTYISHLKTYSNLVELALPSAGDLDPYFDPPDCGTPYLDHPELYDIVHAEREASESRLLRIVEEHLPFLRSVSFGGNRYNLTHSNNTGSNSLNQT